MNLNVKFGLKLSFSLMSFVQIINLKLQQLRLNFLNFQYNEQLLIIT